MQLDNISESNPTMNALNRQSISMTNVRLKKIQRFFGWAAVLTPFLGSVVAIGLLKYQSISLVEVGLLVGMYALTIIGITVGFHRLFAHCSFQTNTVIRVILAILGSMAAQGHIIHWVSNHRRHHQCSDQPGDPHSPHFKQTGESLGLLRGLWHAQVGWLFDSDFPNVLLAKDLLRDSVIVQMNRLYLTWVILGFAIPGVIEGALTGTWIGILQGILWGGFVRVFLVHHAIWSINSITHVLGKRPFKTREQSTNNIWTSIPTGGEAWHNNHHAFPYSAKFGLKWWQIDLGYWFIRVLEVVGLAWDVKFPTTAMIETKKAVI